MPYQIPSFLQAKLQELGQDEILDGGCFDNIDFSERI